MDKEFLICGSLPFCIMAHWIKPVSSRGFFIDFYNYSLFIFICSYFELSVSAIRGNIEEKILYVRFVLHIL